jgi:tRNA(Ile)-lysidine synthase
MKPNDFIEAVRRTVGCYGMNVSRPLALVSGGPDSLALLRVLLDLGAEPTVLHVEHGARGEESLADAEFVRRLCEELGVAYEVRHLDLGNVSNFQEAARRERYRAVVEVADALGLKSIATGHTADDVAETVLMNLARGSGLRGLAGIPPVRGRLVRPLIRATRAEILGYLEALGQPYRTDPTNLTGKYARNRVRQEVLPVLEELYPGARANAARAAGLLREDLEALEELASRVVRREGCDAVIRLPELLNLPRALRRYAVRQAYRILRPEAPGLESGIVESVLELTGAGEGTRTLDLPAGIVAAARTTGELAFYEAREPEAENIEVGVGRFVFGGWEVEVREVDSFDAREAAREEIAYLDAGRGPYRVRMAREGDIIRPLGLGGTKKVLRAMMDRGVPADVRRRTPVVVDGRGAVAWIFCGELGEEYKVRGSTDKILRLEVREVHGNV